MGRVFCEAPSCNVEFVSDALQTLSFYLCPSCEEEVKRNESKLNPGLMYAVCDNSMCGKVITVDEMDDGPYECNECKDRRMQQKFALVQEDYQRNGFNVFKKGGEKHIPVEKSVKVIYDDLMKKDFLLNDKNVPHLYYGAEIVRRELYIDEPGIAVILQHIRPTCLKMEINPAYFLLKKSQRFVNNAALDIITCMSAHEGVRAYEAKVNDHTYKLVGGQSNYMKTLERDTMSVISHSVDSLPF